MVNKRVLHIIETKGPGGAENVYLNLLVGMHKRGFDPIPCVTGKGWLWDELRSKGYEPTIVPTSGSADISFLRKLVKVVRRKKIDMIHSHLLGANLYASLVGFITGVPVISTFHGIVDRGNEKRLLNVLKGKIISTFSVRIVCVSKGLKEQLTENKWLKKEKVQVVYNGINLKRYEGIDCESARALLGFKQDDAIIGAIGNIRPAKGHKYLIESAAILSKKIPNVKYVVVGHAPKNEKESLLGLCRSLEVNDIFKFLGFREDVHEILSGLDVFVVASTSEGFSLATIEALAAGIPVVATRCGGPQEIITEGHDGLLVPIGDPKALANSISRILTNRDLRNKLIRHGRKTAEKFSLTRMLDNYECIYRQLIPLNRDTR